jgi:hypothetical protein
MLPLAPGSHGAGQTKRPGIVKRLACKKLAQGDQASATQGIHGVRLGALADAQTRTPFYTSMAVRRIHGSLGRSVARGKCRYGTRRGVYGIDVRSTEKVHEN